MSCAGNRYFVGQGDVLVRKLDGPCGTPTEGWWKLGNASELMTSISQEFADHKESSSGNSVRDERWLVSSTADFSLTVDNFSIDNLSLFTQGEKVAAVAAGTIATDGETLSNVYEGQWTFTAYQGISAITLKEGATTLVEDTDFTVDSRNGGIFIIEGAPNISGSGPLTLGIGYTHKGTEGEVKSLKAAVGVYQVRFNGIDKNNANKPVIVTIPNAQINAAEELSWISDEALVMSFTGACLKDANGEYFNEKLSNSVA